MNVKEKAEWTCKRCGSHDKPPGINRPTVCIKCKRQPKYEKTCPCGKQFMAMTANTIYCDECRDAKKKQWEHRIQTNSERLSPIPYASKRQLEILLSIEDQLGIEYHGKNRKDLWEFIGDHIFKLTIENGESRKMTERQRRFAGQIEHSLGTTFCGETFFDAQQFIQDHIEAYEKTTGYNREKWFRGMVEETIPHDQKIIMENIDSVKRRAMVLCGDDDGWAILYCFYDPNNNKMVSRKIYDISWKYVDGVSKYELMTESFVDMFEAVSAQI